MLCLNTLAEVARAISDPDLDDDLRTLIAQRGWQAYAQHPSNLSGDTRIIVVQGGDTPDVINTALGFAITGEHAEAPSYDRLEDHGLSATKSNDQRWLGPSGRAMGARVPVARLRPRRRRTARPSSR